MLNQALLIKCNSNIDSNVEDESGFLFAVQLCTVNID